MKPINNRLTGGAIIFTALFLSACVKKEADFPPQAYDFSNTSLIQAYVATVNASRNNIYVDANLITGANLSSGGVFPPGAGAVASTIQPGLKAFLVRDTDPTTTQVPLSFAENMQIGRYYTIFLYDTITAPKQKTVQTNIEVPSDSTARIRFANFVYSATAVPAVDIFSKRRGVYLFTNIPVTEVTNFIPIPSAYTDTFFVRETGTLNQLAVLNTLNPTQKRSYTLVFRGRYQNATGTVARTLSSFINY